MDKWYPVHLNMLGRSCVIIGGGQVALKRILGLVEVGALVTVISPQCHPDIHRLAAQGAVHIEERDYRGGDDLVNADLIFAATHDVLVNNKIADEAKRLRIPINHLGDSRMSNFIVPAVLRRGQLTMSVSTSGASPGLASQIRDNLSEHYGEEYTEYVDFLAELRQLVMMKVENEHDRSKIFHQVLKFDILELIRDQKLPMLRSWLLIVLDQELKDVDWQQQFKLFACNE